MRANIWLIRLVGLISLLSGCGDAMSKETNEFDWYAVASAPSDYPMEVIQGTFFYKGQETGLSIPSGGTLTQGWGESFSAYVVGPKFKPLPDKLRVTFYSYAEKQFYRGEFSLPYDKILNLFQQQQKEDPDHLYNNIQLGIAPGGVVAVWIAGWRVTEVFFGQAEKINIDPSAGFMLPFKSKEQSDEYVESALAEAVTPEQLAYIKKFGPPFGVWNRFRNLYKWAPTYKDGKAPVKPEITGIFLNGERFRIPTHFSAEYANTSKPLLKETNFRAGAEGKIYEIKFDEIELIDVFDKLAVTNEIIYLEFDPRVPRQNMKIRAYNSKESIELKKFKVKE